MMKQYCLFVILSLGIYLVSSSFLLVHAQTIDSLSQIWPDKNRSAEDRFNALYSYYIKVQTQIDGDSLLLMAHSAIELADQLNQPNLSLKAKLLLGSAYIKVDSSFKSIFTIEEAIAEFEKYDAPITNTLAHCYSFLTVSYHSQGNFKQAIYYLQKEEELLSKLEGSKNLLRSRINNKSNLAGLSIEIKDFDAALIYIQEGKRLWEDYKGPEPLLLLLALQGNEAEAYKQSGKLDLAFSTGVKTLNIILGASSPRPVPYTYYRDSLGISALKNLANIYGTLIEVSYTKQEYGTATAYLRDLSIIAEIIDSALENAKALEWEGKLALARRESSKAIIACERALHIAEQNQLPEQERDALYCLYESNVQQGNYKTALGHLENYHMMADSLLNEEKIREIEQLKAQQKFDIFATEAAQQQLQQVAKLKQQRLITFLVIGVLFLFLMAGVFLVRSSYKLKRLNQRLAAVNKRIEYMIHSVSHDILANLDLTISTGNLLPLLENDAFKDSLYLQQMQRTLREIKTYATKLLRSPFLSDYVTMEYNTDLENIMKETLSRYQEKINTKQVHIDASPLPYAQLPENVARQLFENLMNNTLRHGLQHPTPCIKIFTEQVDDNYIKLIWEDNGGGFKNEGLAPLLNNQPKKNSGLTLLRQTLAEYKAYITMDIAPTRGARVEVLLPVV